MRYDNLKHFKTTCGYDIGDIWYPRVTKIIDIKSKPALENFWREMESYSSAEEVKNKSAQEGSLVHSVVEKTLTGEVVEIPDEIRPAMQSFQKFNEERKISVDPAFIERRVVSLRHRYAGTIDALATIDGKFGVLDIKTSNGFYPDYNLQTVAYVSALQEFEVKRGMALPQDVQTRWILRVDQKKNCAKCGATLREKGGRSKIRNGRANGKVFCAEDRHEWGETKGEVELREFPYFYKDLKAFMAAKTLWEWEHDYWLRQAGYLK